MPFCEHVARVCVLQQSRLNIYMQYPDSLLPSLHSKPRFRPISYSNHNQDEVPHNHRPPHPARPRLRANHHYGQRHLVRVPHPKPNREHRLRTVRPTQSSLIRAPKQLILHRHGDHWHCDAPRVTGAAAGNATSTDDDDHHDHDDDDDHTDAEGTGTLPPSPTASVGCEP